MVSRRLLSLCVRHGFVLPGQRTTELSEEIIGCWDAVRPVYGPLGVAMKRNITNEWWYSTVTSPNSVVQPLDSATVTTTDDRLSGLCSAAVDYADYQKLALPFGVAQIASLSSQDKQSSSSSACGVMSQSLVMEHLLQLLFLCQPQHQQWQVYWERRRLQWWRQFAQSPDDFTLVNHKSTADSTIINRSSIMYQFPWGEESVEEVIVNNVSENCQESKVLGDDQSHLIALYHSMYLNKGLHALLFDAYTHYGAQEQTGQEEEIGDKEALQLHLRISPVNVAVLPEVEDHHELNLYASKLTEDLKFAGLSAVFDSNGSLDERLKKQRELGTPYTVVVDEREALTRGVINLLERDSGSMERMENKALLHSLLRMFYRFKV